jgi:hypothetical protein
MVSHTPALEWIVSLPTTCLHAAEAIGSGRTLADGPLAEAITPPARSLVNAIRAAELPWQRFWQHLLPLAAQADNPRQLVQWSLRKAMGKGPRADALLSPLAGWISELFAAARRATPDLAGQLDERACSLRQQWEEVEVGLLATIAQLVDPRILVDSATVVVVDAVQGGGGAAHLWYNSLRIEAVTQDPKPELPEVVRLAWLLAQLNLDLPVFCDRLRSVNLPWLAAVAMLPPTLTAAAQAGILDDPIACIPRALAQWDIPEPPDADLAGTLTVWWRTYQESKPDWGVSLEALERLLSADCTEN